MATWAGAGISEAHDGVRAARQAAASALEAAGTERADWGLMFATTPHRPHFAAMLRTVQETLGTETLSGCSGSGVIGAGVEVEGDAAVTVLAVRSDQIRALPHLIPAEDDLGIGAARQLGQRIPPGPGVLLALPDPFAVRPDLMLLELAATAPGLEAVGGAAAGGARVAGTFQFHGRNVATKALAALHLSGRIRTAVGITQGCQPLGAVCRITKCSENTLLRLDGRPALQALRQRLPPALRESIERLGGHLFVGLPPDPSQQEMAPGEYLVRPIVAVDPARQAIILSEEVAAGAPIQFVLRDGQAAREDLKEMLRRLREPAGTTPWRFGLYINCAGRGASLYGLPGIDSAYLSRQFGGLPIVGFFGNAEIAPLRGANRLFTYTGVLALVGETEGL